MAVKYVEVYGRIKRDITSGRFQTGDFLPTESELMAEYDVSRTTIRKAVGLLRDDGYVDARQGRGTEVTAPQRREDEYDFTSLVGATTVQTRTLADSPSRVTAQAATIETVTAPQRVAQALGIAPDAAVHRVQRLKLVEDEPVAHIASYLPADRFPGLTAHSGSVYYLYQFLAAEYGTRFVRSRSRLSAVAADFIESRILGVAVGAPLILQTRTTDSDAGPIEYSESFERSDRIATFISVAPGTDDAPQLDLVD